MNNHLTFLQHFFVRILGNILMNLTVNTMTEHIHKRVYKSISNSRIKTKNPRDQSNLSELALEMKIYDGIKQILDAKKTSGKGQRMG